MDTVPRYVEPQKSTRFESVQDPRELQPHDISALLAGTERDGFADEALELINMRYQQALALESLQDLYAEGRLDSK